MKLLLFTEHKDTLDYLAGDGKDGRPLGKLREWGLSVTQIHGGMKIGDRDTPGTRIYAEREFKEQAQVLVATEAAGEGINLQFCWFMINFDIPWNPVRLEQRMGRIHRYGQEHDCLIFNFVAVNTNEGRVLAKLLDRLREIRKELGTDQVFDVVGEVFPGNLLERLFRDLYTRKTNVPDIEARIVRDVNPERFRAITESTLEGLAKKELNLSAIVGKSVEARERRLVPEVIEDFFIQAAPDRGGPAQGGRQGRARLPRRQGPPHPDLDRRAAGAQVRAAGQRVPQGRLRQGAAPLGPDPGMGHAGASALRGRARGRRSSGWPTTCAGGRSSSTSSANEPARLDAFAASIKDGRGNSLHRRLFVVETEMSGGDERPAADDLPRRPGPAPRRAPRCPTTPHSPTGRGRAVLLERALQPFLAEVAGEREHQIETIRRHVEISLNTLIDRQNLQLADS